VFSSVVKPSIPVSPEVMASGRPPTMRPAVLVSTVPAQVALAADKECFLR